LPITGNDRQVQTSADKCFVVPRHKQGTLHQEDFRERRLPAKPVVIPQQAVTDPLPQTLPEGKKVS
jgi:hypothetical protein